MRQARNNAAQETAAKTRHLNIWVGADEALFSTRAWHGARNPELDLEQFRGRPCHLGLDLASRTDLAALSLVFPSLDPATGKTTYAAFARCYLNEEAVLEARNASYPGWAAGGHLVVTPGNETDFGVIEDDILDLCRRFRVVSIGYDPWQSTSSPSVCGARASRWWSSGRRRRTSRRQSSNLDAAMRAGRLEHDGNPVLEWCIGNVVGRGRPARQPLPDQGPAGAED
ncbi:terminase TerL endonuclease subunit [Dankookia sp. P2]|uniref:terminase TerL endonuclease subunit n=1 Tax=Dankookia sp. P2 TaxID=3423955 RepID=UPI003D678DBF